MEPIATFCVNACSVNVQMQILHGRTKDTRANGVCVRTSMDVRECECRRLRGRGVHVGVLRAYSLCVRAFLNTYIHTFTFK